MANSLLHTSQKASKEQTRVHNRRLVLQAIADRGETSRAVIARATGLTPPTVSSIVRDLADDGVIEERGTSEATAVGKPPQLVGIAGGQYQMACLDLSGPHFTGALIDLDGTVVGTASGAATDLSGGDALAAAVSLAAELLDAATAPELRVSVATPGVVDNDGNVRRAAFFDWTDVALAADLEAATATRAFVVNDSHALALAEYAHLEERVDNLVAVRIARGVSVGIVLHRALYAGDGFGAGEIGFLLPSTAGPASAHRAAVSISQLVADIGGQQPGSWDLDRAVASADAVTVATVASAMGADLGRALAAVVGVLDIHTVRIEPLISCLGPALLESAFGTLRAAVVDSIASQVDIQFGQSGRDGILRGAAMTVTHQDLGLIG